MTPNDRVLTVGDVRQMVSYVRTAFDFDGKTADWALDEITNLLDALKSRNGLVNPARMDTCTHYGIDSGGTDYYGTSNPSQEADWNYTFCPKCGEKL